MITSAAVRMAGAVRPSSDIPFNIFLQRRGIKLMSNQVVLWGLTVTPAEQKRLAGYLGGVTEVALSGGLSFGNLRKIFSNPELMELSLAKAGSRLTVNRLQRPDELAGRIEEMFSRSPLRGLRLLTGLGKQLRPDEVRSFLRDQRDEIAPLFTVENRNSDEFTGLLELLRKSGDHGLIRDYLVEFTENDAHDPAWAASLLRFLREHFPGEPVYHEADGDLNRQAGILVHAREAYERALALVPGDAVLRQKVKETVRSLAQAETSRRADLQRTVALLWWQCAAGDRQAPALLCRLALDSPRDIFGLLDEAARPLVEEANLAVFDFLAAAAERDRPELAEHWRWLSDKRVTRLFWRLAEGRRIDEHSLGLVLQLTGEIEFIPPDLLARLKQPHERYRELCADVYDRHVKLGELNEKAIADLKAGRLAEALEGLRHCRRLAPGDEGIRHNIAVALVALMKEALGRGDRAGAGKYSVEALEHDPECLPALETLAMMAMLAGDLDSGIALAQRMKAIALARWRQGGQEAAACRRIYIMVLCNQGMALLRRYQKNQKSGGVADLKDARANLEKAVQLEPGNLDFRYYLAKTRLLQGELAAVVEWGSAYFAGGKIKFVQAVDLAETFQDYFSRHPWDGSVEPLLRAMSNYLKAEAQSGSGREKEERETARGCVHDLAELCKREHL